MSFYKKIFNEKFGVYYPSAVTVGQPVPVKKVAKRLSQMCTVTYADVMAVLGELPGVMADYMGQGKSVRLDGLGTFRYTLKTKGVTDEARLPEAGRSRARPVCPCPRRCADQGLRIHPQPGAYRHRVVALRPRHGEDRRRHDH